MWVKKKILNAFLKGKINDKVFCESESIQISLFFKLPPKKKKEKKLHIFVQSKNANILFLSFFGYCSRGLALVISK